MNLLCIPDHISTVCIAVKCFRVYIQCTEGICMHHLYLELQVAMEEHCFLQIQRGSSLQ